MYNREHSSNNKCKLIGMGRKQTLAPYSSHMVIIEVAALEGKKGEFKSGTCQKTISN